MIVTSWMGYGSTALGLTGATHCFQEVAQQCCEFGHSCWINAITGARTINLPFDHPDLLQRFQVLRHGRLGKGNEVHNLATDAFIAARKFPQNGNASRVSKGFCYAGKPDISLIEVIVLDKRHGTVPLYRIFTI
jgi:hypothetical protein